MKKIILTVSIIIITVAIILLGGWLYYQRLYNAYKSESAAVHTAAEGDSLATNSMAHFSDLDIAIYGKWEDQNQSLNYRVFTLDDAGDGYYWGKEWCEAENVFEEDLEEHGNGWFRWKAKQNSILLLYQTNVGITIPSECMLKQVDEDQLSLKTNFSRSTNVLNRVYN